MLGTIVNAAAIIAGSLAGFIINLMIGKIPERINDTIMKGVGLSVLLIGISSSLKVNNTLLVIFSMVTGGIIGEVIDIDKVLKRLGDGIEKRLKGRGGKISEGFVTASLVYCIGAMAVVGSLESGISGNHATLFAKSVLDGVSAIVFTSSLGIGVALSAVSVFIYQGAITLAASSLSGILTTTVVNDMSAVGGLLIIGIAINMLNLGKMKVANLLPAVFIPVLYQVAVNVWKLLGM
jgi:uncharacterized membrane protein YqgA involved in biofilm formation